MSEQNLESETPEDRDRKRLSLEEKSVKLQNEQLFIEQWRLGVNTAEARAQQTSSAAVQAGQQGLRTLAFVNAGALIGLPSFAKGFSAASITASNLAPAMLGFVLGLSLTLLAMFFAYLTNYCAATSQFLEGQIRAIELNARNSDRPSDSNEERTRTNEQKERFDTYARCSQYLSIGLALAAIGFFIGGAVWGWYIVT